ncbi:hypothetical protein Ciccas_009938, partial [Cichlidogyrus casuarinus]
KFPKGETSLIKNSELTVGYMPTLNVIDQTAIPITTIAAPPPCTAPFCETNVKDFAQERVPLFQNVDSCLHNCVQPTGHPAYYLSCNQHAYYAPSTNEWNLPMPQQHYFQKYLFNFFN